MDRRSILFILCAAHNGDGAASESLVMNGTRVHVVITDLWKRERPQASSVENVLSRAGQARFRAAALSECCRPVKQAARSLVCGAEWSPSPDRMGEGQARGACSWEGFWGHRSRDGGPESSSSRVNRGPSGSPRADGINQQPAVVGGNTDLAIVSEQAGGQNNRWRSQGPLDGCVVSEAVSAAG